MEYTIGTEVFGGWKIIRELGAGAYGKVFEIQKTAYGITANSALKVIHVPHSESDIKAAFNEGMDEQSVTSYFEGFVEEIVKEIALMTELKSHPNIVGYEDHNVIAHTDTIGWDILIKMELLTALSDYQRKNQMNENDILRMGIDLCRALVFCQEKGMIHRDIKPDNIFVSRTGQFKLGDFGVARTIEKTTGGLSKKGTESYMAPEVYLGRSYGASVDIYSLGLVLYKFCNENRLPFCPPLPKMITFADRENALAERMAGEALPAPQQASEAFAQVILKACAYNPKDRYRTAAEMLKALEQINETGNVPEPVDIQTETEEQTIGMDFGFPEEQTVGMNMELPEEKTVGVDFDSEEEKTIGMNTELPKQEDDRTIGMEMIIPETKKDTVLEAAMKEPEVKIDLSIPSAVTGKTKKKKGRFLKALAVLAAIVICLVLYMKLTKTHYVGIHRGSGDGFYRAGETVTIVADEPGEGEVFNMWAVSAEERPTLTRNGNTATFVMPDSDVRLVALYKKPDKTN